MNDKNQLPGENSNLKDISFENSQEVRYRQDLKWSSYLLWSIIGSVLFAIVYAFSTKIDEVITARGELQAYGAERLVKSPFEGIVGKIKVKEGQKVQSGQELIQINSEIFKAKEEGLTSKIAGLEKSLGYEIQILDGLSSLLKEGAVPYLQYINQKKNIQNIKSEIAEARAKLKEINIIISNSNLTSPVTGFVFNLVPSSPGYVVQNGETLLKVVPEGILEAEIFLTNQNIGFVKKNMNAEVRIDAYPFTQFGSIKGKLKFIGEEVLPADSQNPQSRFPAIVSLENQFLKSNNTKFALKSGQSVTVNLIAREKRLITLLTDSIDKAFDALRRIKSDRK